MKLTTKNVFLMCNRLHLHPQYVLICNNILRIRIWMYALFHMLLNNMYNMYILYVMINI